MSFSALSLSSFNGIISNCLHNFPSGIPEPAASNMASHPFASSLDNFPQDIVVYCSGSCSPAYFCRFFNKCSWQCQHSIGVQYIPLVAAFSYTLITRQHHCCELLACQFLCWSVFIPCNYMAASTCQLDWTERVHVFLLIDVSLILLSPRY